jgi:uncharacterized protein (DUF1684 family)
MTDPIADDRPEILQLADWRRQVADLYAEVRRLIRSDHEAAVELWRSKRERLFRDHAQSPVLLSKREAFRAHHYPIDPALRFEVLVEPDSPVASSSSGSASAFGGFGAPIDFGGANASPPSGGTMRAAPLASDLPVSAGGTMAMRRIGRVEIPFPAGVRSLVVFWMSGYAGGLFIPFRDATNGTETYGAGRYLIDGAKSADLGGDPVRGTVILDFNFAYHPSCAFDPKWACPLAPPDSRLDIPVRAGERLT